MQQLVEKANKCVRSFPPATLRDLDMVRGRCGQTQGPEATVESRQRKTFLQSLSDCVSVQVLMSEADSAGLNDYVVRSFSVAKSAAGVRQQRGHKSV